MNRRLTTLIVGVILLAGFGALAYAAPVDYVELVPGPTFDTLGTVKGKPVISISGAPTTSDSNGQLRMLTVGEIDKITAFDVVRGWFDRDNAVLPAEVLIPPGESEQQLNQQSTDQFKQSQSSAVTAALRHEGYPVLVTIASVVAGKPAQGHLQAGDVVTTVDGQQVLSADDLAAFIQAKPVGATLQIGYTRSGKATVTPIKTVAGSDGKPQIGVEVQQTQPSPIKVSIQLENVGGPSAGLMFTLGIIDKLGPTDLTGGRIIAGTGTMDDDGDVGPIGGIAQKMIAARAAGARYFLAPADNCAEALRSPVSGLTLVKVTNLDGALTALADVRSGTQPPLCTR
ncbi:MAG TPA: PDZ domain-containing protein [Micromonosporaceae bacterium]|nr:PDZ domain-containing protein [Micromonosporaceae bacterium]